MVSNNSGHLVPKLVARTLSVIYGQLMPECFSQCLQMEESCSLYGACMVQRRATNSPLICETQTEVEIPHSAESRYNTYSSWGLIGHVNIVICRTRSTTPAGGENIFFRYTYIVLAGTVLHYINTSQIKQCPEKSLTLKLILIKA